MRRLRGFRVVAGFLPLIVVAGVLSTAGADPAHALGPPTLTSIALSPASASIAKGQTQQFTALGHFSDGSSQDVTNIVTWSSSQGLLAALSNVVGSQGRATGLLPGVSTVTATAPAGLLGGLLGWLLSPVSGTGTLTVLPAVLTAISVVPSVTSITQGQTQQFTATGLFSDLSTQDITKSVTWSSSQGLLASVSNVLGSRGLATGLLPGVSTITATDPATLIPGTALLTVLTGLTGPLSPPPVPSLTITPGSGKRRTPVVAHGANFPSGGSVVVTYLSGLRSRHLASAVLCNSVVAQDGTFSCRGVVPRGARSGRRGGHTVTALATSGKSGSTIFTLVVR
jgi:hypothetical protein